jgi:hypothetical protein
MSGLCDEDIKRISDYIVTNYINNIRGPPGKQGDPGKDPVIRANLLSLATGISRTNEEIRLLKEQLEATQEELASLRLTTNTLRCQVNIASAK